MQKSVDQKDSLFDLVSPTDASPSEGEACSLQPEVHPSLLLRKIIHFDMDAFYASVEVRDRPELRGLPVVVGGSPESRGVVCTASYEARKFGVKSAMACARAKRLCPDAVFLRPDFSKYKKVSDAIRAIFRKHTDLVEPLSLDEAYLDVTNHPEGLYAVQAAKAIQKEIFETLHLTGSAGVAPNKMLAKIASDLRKPFGISVVLPYQVTEFMRQLPLRKIHGIGPASERRLLQHGFRLCSDVWPYSLAELQMRVGNSAAWLYDRTRGIDERGLSMGRKRKSIGRETTFDADTKDLEALDKVLRRLSRRIASYCTDYQIKARTITVKVKFADFEQVTRSLTSHDEMGEEADLFDAASVLLRQAQDFSSLTAKKIRLLGISLSSLRENSEESTDHSSLDNSSPDKSFVDSTD